MVNYDFKKIYEWPLGARWLVLAAISVTILLLGYFIDINSYKDLIKTNVQQEIDLRKQLQLMIEKQVTMKGDIVQLPRSKALLTDWQKKIISKNELPGLLDTILRTGQNNNLKIIAFSPDKEVADGPYFKTPVSMDITGTYDQIAEFISQLANMSKLVNIDNYTISNLNENKIFVSNNAESLTSDVILTAKLNIEIYRK
jgi:type IV pilus assembly protein PilO